MCVFLKQIQCLQESETAVLWGWLPVIIVSPLNSWVPLYSPPWYAEPLPHSCPLLLSPPGFSSALHCCQTKSSKHRCPLSFILFKAATLVLVTKSEVLCLNFTVHYKLEPASFFAQFAFPWFPHRSVEAAHNAGHLTCFLTCGLGCCSFLSFSALSQAHFVRMYSSSAFSSRLFSDSGFSDLKFFLDV